MKPLLRRAAVCLSLCTPFAARAQSHLLVANQKDHTVQIFDPATTRQTAAVLESGITGHEIAVSPDGRNAYVPIYGNSGVGKPGTDGDHIDILDLASATVIGAIPFSHGVRPHCILYDRHTGMLLVTTELDQAVAIIDPNTRAIVGSIPTGQQQSHMIVLSPDGSRLYSANVGPGTVSVMDVPHRKLLKIIPISGSIQRISISRDGATVFTADQTKPELVAIDTVSSKVRRRIPIPAVAYGTAATLDGKDLLVAMQAADRMAVIDIKTLQVVQSFPIPKGVYEIVLNPDGKTAYASIPSANQVALIDLRHLAVSTLIPAGSFPDGLAWAESPQ